MSGEGFLTTAWTAELFFRFCARYKINDEPGRIAVMREIVRRKKATYVRDVEGYIQGKKVLVVKRSPNEKNN